jgi:hypothetical protein
MNRLLEVKATRQIRGEPRRRWFNSPEMDLYVWYDDADEMLGFQLCYGKFGIEKALTWFRPGAYSHMRVLGGGADQDYGTPLLVPDGTFEPEVVRDVFACEAKDVPSEIVAFVADRLAAFPGAPV